MKTGKGNNKNKKSKINFDDIIKSIPLRTRIRVINEMELISALTDLGIREDRSWGDDEQELLNKIIMGKRWKTRIKH